LKSKSLIFCIARNSTSWLSFRTRRRIWLRRELREQDSAIKVKESRRVTSKNRKSLRSSTKDHWIVGSAEETWDLKERFRVLKIVIRAWKTTLREREIGEANAWAKGLSGPISN
jgi:hypothetical protein